MAALIGQPTPEAGEAPATANLIRQAAYQVIGIGAVLVATAICLHLFDRRKLRTIGYQLHRGWWTDYLLGAAISATMLCTVVVVGLVTEALQLQAQGDEKAAWLTAAFLALLFFNVAAVTEELMFRGYPLQTLLLDCHPVMAIAVPAVIFGLVHLPNPNSSALSTANTILAGLWLGVAYFKTRSLWLCTGLHWAWNFAMGPVFGLSISGLDPMLKHTLLRSRASGPVWLMGGDYGPEGGIIVTAVLTVTTWALFRSRIILRRV